MQNKYDEVTEWYEMKMNYTEHSAMFTNITSLFPCLLQGRKINRLKSLIWYIMMMIKE